MERVGGWFLSGRIGSGGEGYLMRRMGGSEGEVYILLRDVGFRPLKLFALCKVLILQDSQTKEELGSLLDVNQQDSFCRHLFGTVRSLTC